MSERTSRTISVGSRVGLHARPAAIVAAAAAEQSAVVTIVTPGGKTADARSLLSLLSLGVGHADEVELWAEGEGAAASVDALAELLASDLDEE